MAYRFNTRNSEKGMESRSGQKTDWGKFFSRHLSNCTASEILAFEWATDDLPKIKKAVEKRFSPRLVGEHLYILCQKTFSDICIGYIDEVGDGYYMISLDSCFGEHSEVCFGKKRSCERLFEIYKEEING